MPAGTVNVVVTTNGDVTVTGDNNDNDVAVNVTASQVSITGNERTKVKFNGQVFRAGEIVVIDEFDDAALLGSLNVDMKDGDDNIKVTLDSVMLEIARNLTVKLGDGDDSLRVESLGETKLTVNGDVKLLGGDGADAFIVIGSIFSPEIVLNKTLTVDLGAGVDLFGLGRDHAPSEGPGFPDDSVNPDADPAFFDFGIFTGFGIGNFTVKGDVKIIGGEGVDAIGLNNSGNVMFQKNLEITTGADADFLEWQLGSEVSVTVLGDAKIETQDDSDLIFLKFGGAETFGQSVHFAKSLTVNTGTGEDLVSIELADLTVNGEAKINSGTGYDGILVQNFGHADFRKSLDINTGTGHALVNLQSSGLESSLSVAGDLKITTGALSDYVFVGDVLVQIGGELKIETGNGSDFVGIEFGSILAVFEEGVVSSVGKDLKIDTGTGSDQVSVDVLSETNLKGKLDIKTGTQSDFVSLNADAGLTIDKDVNIDSGNHSDKVVFRPGGFGPVLIKGTLNITLGNEDDGLLLGDSGGFPESFVVQGDIKIAAGVGDDVINVQGVTTNRDLIVDSGNDHDKIAVESSHVGRDLIVNGGAGDDDIEVSSATDFGVERDLKIDSGTGNDRVIANELLVGRNVDVKLGAGNDQLDVVLVLLSGTNPSVKVDGGAGADFGATDGFLPSNIMLPPLNINRVSITEDDLGVDQNGDGNPVDVDAMATHEDILEAINSCFADQLNPVG